MDTVRYPYIICQFLLVIFVCTSQTCTIAWCGWLPATFNSGQWICTVVWCWLVLSAM